MSTNGGSRTGTLLLTLLALLAFSANSLLCRMALGDELIDPVSFTGLRIASGALALLAFTWRPNAAPGTEPLAAPWSTGSWTSALALFGYALCFSLAYVSLSTGMGALVLFACVQLTMLTAAWRAGDRFGVLRWFGFAAACSGLLYLMIPGLMAPDPPGLVLMAIAGLAWGIYSLRGRGAGSPALLTAGNFLRATPLVLIALGVAGGLAPESLHLQSRGLWLALASGVITSGFGYVIWYRAQPGLSTSQAAIVQLLVPIIAALGGILVLDESLTLRLLIASVLVLGGVALAIPNRKAAGLEATDRKAK